MAAEAAEGYLWRESMGGLGDGGMSGRACRIQKLAARLTGDPHNCGLAAARQGQVNGIGPMLDLPAGPSEIQFRLALTGQSIGTKK